ncbi:MAG: hypothetical protein KDA96_26530, partial [Planctomycetaceae bacterium]|nr:hypothetical protein [Planctomycetaceae bacterium]
MPSTDFDGPAEAGTVLYFLPMSPGDVSGVAGDHRLRSETVPANRGERAGLPAAVLRPATGAGNAALPWLSSVIPADGGLGGIRSWGASYGVVADMFCQSRKRRAESRCFRGGFRLSV